MSLDVESLIADIQREHRIGKSPRVPRGTLSQREIEVLKLLCDGQGHKQIAQALDVSRRTVDAHHWHITQKTGCTTGAQLGVWAVRNGIVECG